MFEGFSESRQGGRTRKKALTQALGLGTGRLVYKVPAAFMLAHGIIRGQKKRKKGHGILPVALAGAGAGSLNRFGDLVAKELTEKATTKGYKFRANKAFGRKLVGALSGGAVGGVLGGLVLSKAVSMAKKSLQSKK